MDEQYGRILPPKRTIVRQHVGTATADENGITYNYEMSLVWGVQCPAVYCQETKRYYILEWEDILQLAAVAGINQPHQEPSK